MLGHNIILVVVIWLPASGHCLVADDHRDARPRARPFTTPLRVARGLVIHSHHSGLSRTRAPPPPQSRLLTLPYQKHCTAPGRARTYAHNIILYTRTVRAHSRRILPVVRRSPPQPQPPLARTVTLVQCIATFPHRWAAVALNCTHYIFIIIITSGRIFFDRIAVGANFEFWFFPFIYRFNSFCSSIRRNVYNYIIAYR